MKNNKLKEYNSIEELLDAMTTSSKTGEKHIFSDIGSPENNYAIFKDRFEVFKEHIKEDLPELTIEEVLKFHKFNNKFKDTIYSWFGFSILLDVLEWERLNKT